jgi:uncharacterized GH25 family protein
MRSRSLLVPLLLTIATAASAHDSWLQTNTNIIRIGDAIHIDLMLGNHGNEHRDFKLASKLDISGSIFKVVTPDHKTYDLKDRLIDTGYTPQEGFWTAKMAFDKPGMYVAGSLFDKVMTYAPERAIQSSKAFFVVSKSLDKVPEKNPGVDKPLGHPLELVPVTNPVTPMGPGMQLRVQLLYKGKPLANEHVVFIPRGETLKEGKDDRYERTSDANGIVSFTPTGANYYLVAAHHREDSEKGQGYDFTKYGATMTVFVPQICPCCGG